MKFSLRELLLSVVVICLFAALIAPRLVPAHTDGQPFDELDQFAKSGSVRIFTDSFLNQDSPPELSFGAGTSTESHSSGRHNFTENVSSIDLNGHASDWVLVRYQNSLVKEFKKRGYSVEILQECAASDSDELLGFSGPYPVTEFKIKVESGANPSVIAIVLVSVRPNSENNNEFVLRVFAWADSG
jgi:hypothetical protein